jgi:hypothetical protein
MFATKYIGYTNTLNARIKVLDMLRNRSSYYDWNDSLDVDENHDEAFRQAIAMIAGLSKRQWSRISAIDGFLYVTRDSIQDMNI